MPLSDRPVRASIDGISNMRDDRDADAFRMFAVAWFFLIATAVLGVLLRLQVVAPLPGISYGNILHAHSHVAFLGWVFNAFFALVYLAFVEERRRRSFVRVFVALQAANLGMLISYPLYGYGFAGLLFTTIHMAGTLVFTVMLWKRSMAVGPARFYLRTSLVFLLISGAGPLALGPLAAMDLRTSPMYDLSVAWYLHFQYNGWFVFLLLSLLTHRLREHSGALSALWRAFPFLAAGVVLTFALSALQILPVPWVYGICLAGGTVQLAGCGIAARGVWAVRRELRLPGRVPVILATAAGAAFLIKCALQLAAAFPALHNLATNHFTVIGFLHWVFLMVVAPALVGIAADRGWLATGPRLLMGLLVWAAGIGVNQFALFYPPVAGRFGLPHLPILHPTLLAAGLLMTAGIVLMSPGTRAWRDRVCT